MAIVHQAAKFPSIATASTLIKPQTNKPTTPTPTSGTPNEVCQLFQYGSDPGLAVNGNSSAENRLAIEQLNAQLVGPTAILSRLPASDPMAIWPNYQLVGALWTQNGQASGNIPPVPSALGPANKNSAQRGALELANVTLETFQQGPKSAIPNCFGCHNYDPTKPLNASHIIDSLLQSKPTDSSN